ncbi:MAG TPA: type II toxin-antitoxin system PemK/MazF family toxin [Candidatus Angelobacter sp.]|jgi:mRNA interferase MazF
MFWVIKGLKIENTEDEMNRGEIYRVRKPGGDAKQHRLFVVVSRQVLINSNFSTVICAPVFSNGQGLSTQVSIGPEQGLKHPSWIMCDNLVSLRKTELSDYVALLPPEKIAELNRCLRTALSL